MAPSKNRRLLIHSRCLRPQISLILLEATIKPGSFVVIPENLDQDHKTSGHLNYRGYGHELRVLKSADKTYSANIVIK